MIGRSPAARMISIGTDGHERTTAGRSAVGKQSRELVNVASKAAVSVAMAEVVMMSDHSVSAQLLDGCLTISQPLAIDERIVLADRGRRPQRWSFRFRKGDGHAHADDISHAAKLRVIERHGLAAGLNARISHGLTPVNGLPLQARHAAPAAARVQPSEPCE